MLRFTNSRIAFDVNTTDTDVPLNLTVIHCVCVSTQTGHRPGAAPVRTAGSLRPCAGPPAPGWTGSPSEAPPPPGRHWVHRSPLGEPQPTGTAAS